MTLLLSLLGKVPAWAWLVLGLAAWGGWHRWQAIDTAREFERARVQAEADRARSEAQAAVETNRRIERQSEAIHVAEQAKTRARADAVSAQSAAERLRVRLAALEAVIRGEYPAAAGASAPAAAAAGMLTDVLGRCIDRVRSLAEHADAARTAGQACERSYDALTPSTPKATP